MDNNEKKSFEKLNFDRKEFIKKNCEKDHVVVLRDSNVLISVPHGVSQVRLGKFKVSEIGSLTTALFLKNTTKCSLIAKTKNNNDDANFDENSSYKEAIIKLIENGKIKFIIDLHGLASVREIDVNLGTFLGLNIKNNELILNRLCEDLTKSGFSISIDQPFMAGGRTIAGWFSKNYSDLWTIQLEINCSLTNKKENFKRYNKLLNILKKWIEFIIDQSCE